LSWRLRAKPEDFEVDEVPLYAPSGEGSHTFVRIEKRMLTTEQAASALARAAGVRPRDVGYAGRKDRIALTRQWLSVPGLDPEAALRIEDRGLRVLEAARHGHKLRTGHLRANRFALYVRDVPPDQAAAAAQRLLGFCEKGMPNYFGPQRFGRRGDNTNKGRAILAGERARDKREARFLLSALQAAVFNAALTARSLPVDVLELGDVAQLRESGGLFLVEDLGSEAPRAERFEISATGPVFGTKMMWPEGEPLERERQALRSLDLDPDALPRPPRGVRLQGARRALRVRPEDVSAEPFEGGLRLDFTLPPGSYATVLIGQLRG